MKRHRYFIRIGCPANLSYNGYDLSNKEISAALFKKILQDLNEQYLSWKNDESMSPDEKDEFVPCLEYKKEEGHSENFTFIVHTFRSELTVFYLKELHADKGFYWK